MAFSLEPMAQITLMTRGHLSGPFTVLVSFLSGRGSHRGVRLTWLLPLQAVVSRSHPRAPRPRQEDADSAEPGKSRSADPRGGDKHPHPCMRAADTGLHNQPEA